MPFKNASESLNHLHNLHLDHASVTGLPGLQLNKNQYNGYQMKQDPRLGEIVKG